MPHDQQIPEIAVVGRSIWHGQLVAQWLADVGCAPVTVSDFDAPLPDEDVEAAIILAENDDDVNGARAWRKRVPPPMAVVGGLLAPSWTLLLEMIRLPAHAVVVLPVAGDLLRQIVIELRRRDLGNFGAALLPLAMLESVPEARTPRPLPDPAPLLAVLTPREHQILALLDRDCTNQEIAERLVISPHTVKRHLEHLFRKLGVGSRHEAVRLAHRCGLLMTRRDDPPGNVRGGLALDGAPPAAAGGRGAWP
jgi:DNA-binding CsgD family transcriptional regulator